jgi:flagellar protein FlgJ
MTAAITDFNQFTGLRAAADRQDPEALREVAGQFEALFLQSMLKSMRDASMGDPIFGESDQLDMYQGMMDQQLSLEMASGKGIGLADMLVRQLGGTDTKIPTRPDGSYSLADISRTRSPAAANIQPYSSPTLSVSLQSRAETATQSAVPPKAPPTWSDPKSFARDIWPHAERAGRKLNVAPEAIVAQAALETGWGAHVMPDGSGENSFNLFGIKAGGGWQGDQVSRRTLEFENGVPRPQNAQFRAYNDVSATFADYADFLTDNPRYSEVSGHGNDVAGFANALQSAGYATDPQYADKITRVVNSPTMQSVIRDLKNSEAAPITTQLSLRAQ